VNYAGELWNLERNHIQKNKTITEDYKMPIIADHKIPRRPGGDLRPQDKMHKAAQIVETLENVRKEDIEEVLKIVKLTLGY